LLLMDQYTLKEEMRYRISFLLYTYTHTHTNQKLKKVKLSLSLHHTMNKWMSGCKVPCIYNLRTQTSGQHHALDHLHIFNYSVLHMITKDMNKKQLVTRLGGSQLCLTYRLAKSKSWFSGDQLSVSHCMV
jgi:hypothetical protein